MHLLQKQVNSGVIQPFSSSHIANWVKIKKLLGWHGRDSCVSLNDIRINPCLHALSCFYIMSIQKGGCVFFVCFSITLRTVLQSTLHPFHLMSLVIWVRLISIHSVQESGLPLEMEYSQPAVFQEVSNVIFNLLILIIAMR